jgi:hypothetical protein
VAHDRVLAEIKRLTSLDRVELRLHAYQRMLERAVTIMDVCSALLSATGVRWQADRETWRVEGGVDLDGDDLVVIVVLEADVVVVTVF